MRWTLDSMTGFKGIVFRKKLGFLVFVKYREDIFIGGWELSLVAYRFIIVSCSSSLPRHTN